MSGPSPAVALTGAGALLVSVLLGWGATVLVLRLARVPEVHPAGVSGRDGRAVVLEEPVRTRQVLRGGTWIGVLERLAVTTCVLTGSAALIAVVVAVKGLGRYPELRDNPAASERFLIGTGTSMLVAVWVGLVARMLPWW